MATTIMVCFFLLVNIMLFAKESYRTLLLKFLYCQFRKIHHARVLFFFFFMLTSLKYFTLGINSGSGKSNEQKHILEGNLNLYYMKWKLLIKYAFISSFSWSFNKVSKGIKRKQKRVTKNEGRERWWENSTEFSERWKAAGEWCSVKEAINMGAYIGSICKKTCFLSFSSFFLFSLIHPTEYWKGLGHWGITYWGSW